MSCDYPTDSLACFPRINTKVEKKPGDNGIVAELVVGPRDRVRGYRYTFSTDSNEHVFNGRETLCEGCPTDLTPNSSVTEDMPNQSQTEQTEMATVRDEYPSGLRVLMQNESVGYMIDALMDMPGTTFSKSRLAENAGVSRQSVHTHITLLVNLGIVKEVDNSDPVEYTLNDGDEIIRLLHRLEGVVNRRLNPKVDD